MATNAKEWRFRVLILSPGAEDNAAPEADTHPGEPLDARLGDSYTALGAVTLMEKVSDIVHNYYGAANETIEGARVRDLTRRVPTLRVYLSSHNGRTTLRIPFTPDNASHRVALLLVERPDVR